MALSLTITGTNRAVGAVNGSKNVTAANTTGWVVGATIQGTGWPVGTKIESFVVNSGGVFSNAYTGTTGNVNVIASSDNATVLVNVTSGTETPQSIINAGLGLTPAGSVKQINLYGRMRIDYRIYDGATFDDTGWTYYLGLYTYLQVTETYTGTWRSGFVLQGSTYIKGKGATIYYQQARASQGGTTLGRNDGVPAGFPAKKMRLHWHDVAWIGTSGSNYAMTPQLFYGEWYQCGDIIFDYWGDSGANASFSGSYGSIEKLSMLKVIGGIGAGFDQTTITPIGKLEWFCIPNGDTSGNNPDIKLGTPHNLPVSGIAPIFYQSNPNITFIGVNSASSEIWDDYVLPTDYPLLTNSRNYSNGNRTYRRTVKFQLNDSSGAELTGVTAYVKSGSNVLINSVQAADFNEKLRVVWVDWTTRSPAGGSYRAPIQTIDNRNQVAQFRKHKFQQQSFPYILTNEAYSQPVFLLAEPSLVGVVDGDTVTGITIDWTAKTVTANTNDYDKINTRMDYELALPANSDKVDPRTITGSKLSLATGWSLIVPTGQTITAGVNIKEIYVPTITINGTGKITAVYSNNVTTNEAVTATNGSNIIVVSDLSNWFVGSSVSGTGLVAGTIVTEITGNNVKLSNNYTGTTGSASLSVVSVRTSTVLTISGFGANSAVYVEDNNAVQKYFNADVTGSVVLYIPPTASGSWYYAVEKFGNQRQSDFFTFSGGQKSIVVKELPDNKILLSKAQTLALTTADNPDETYDAFALLRLDVPYISFGQIVSKDGATLYGSDYDIIIDADAENVVEADYDTKVITIKSALFEAGPVCNLVKVDVPKTVTANATEVINVNIEDANGDSTTEIKGVSGSLVDVWKCVNGTVNADYETGTKIAENIGAGNFRFIHQDGFKLIFFDKDTLMARDCSMSKGTYTLGWYVYNNSQGGLDQNQSDKFETIFSKVDVIDDNVVSVKGTVENLSASSGATVAEIEALGLAKEATSEQIKTKVDTLSNYDDSAVIAKIDAIKNVADSIKTTVEDKTGYALTTAQIELIAVAVESHLLDEGDNQMLINAIVGAIGNANIDETVLVSAIRADIERADGMLKAVKTKADTLNNADFTDTNALIVDLGSPLQAADYVAPDNAKIVQIKTKVDTLNNADFTTTNNKIDAVKTKVDTLENADFSVTNDKIDALAEASGETTPATIKAEIKPMLDKLNEGLQLLSEFEPYVDNLPN